MNKVEKEQAQTEYVRQQWVNETRSLKAEITALRVSETEWANVASERAVELDALRAEVERLDQQGEYMTRDRDAWRETAYEREREADNLRASLQAIEEGK